MVANNAASAGPMSQGPNTMKAASFDSLLAASKKQLSKTVADSVTSIENKLTAIREPSQMAVCFLQLSGIWERNKQMPMAAYYKYKQAKLENSAKGLTFAGQIFLKLMQDETEPSVQVWEAAQAAACLESSVAIDPTNEDTKLALATAYIEGTGEPMRGVQILRDITKEKPDDIPANMLLGRMSIQSRQFDKAVKRFETVLKQDSTNSEAVFFMAQAYEGLGDKTKAIALLELCKRLVKKPEFSKEVDNKISTLK